MAPSRTRCSSMPPKGKRKVMPYLATAKGQKVDMEGYRRDCKVGQKDKCTKRPRVRSYRGTEVDRLVQKRKRAQLLRQAPQDCGTEYSQ